VDQQTITRRRRRRWTEAPHQTVPAELAAALCALRRQGDGRLNAALVACRDASWGVPALAAAVKMTPAAVAQRISRARRDQNTVSDLVIPTPDLPAEAHPHSGLSGGPNPALPYGVAAHLRALRVGSQRINGWTPHDDPLRVNMRHLVEDINLLLEKGYRASRVAQGLGVTQRAVDHLLERYGYRKPAPSARNRRPRS